MEYTEVYAVTLRPNIETKMFDTWKSDDPDEYYTAVIIGEEGGQFIGITWGNPVSELCIISRNQFEQWFDVMERLR